MNPRIVISRDCGAGLGFGGGYLTTVGFWQSGQVYFPGPGALYLTPRPRHSPLTATVALLEPHFCTPNHGSDELFAGFGVTSFRVQCEL